VVSPAPVRHTDRPVPGWKRAQLLVRPEPPHELRFAGPAEPAHVYRVDDVFTCRRGHRRVELDCTCGFYAVEDPATLRPSVVRTVLLAVELEGRVVRHATCLRAERQRVRQVAVDGWCAFCVHPAVAVAGVRPLFAHLPDPWCYAVPVCRRDQELFAVTLGCDEVSAALAAEGAAVTWDRARESAAALSLRRMGRYRARTARQL
jgi:hypothetical protein